MNNGGIDINNMRQNHPELIVRDLSTYVSPDITRQVLLYRGVNKWLRVRRLLIQLKDRWREEIKVLEAKKKQAKTDGDIKKYHQLQGAVKALIDCRCQVRALCHSPREVNFPESPRDFGGHSELPLNFPHHPNKRWFWKHNGIRVGICDD